MIPSRNIIAVLVMLCAWWLHSHAQQADEQKIRESLLSKDSITVLVTDSGLGGLSVSADIARRALTQHCYRSIRLVFANALPGSTQGYNQLPTLEEKARVFSAALAGMYAKTRPDVILIACNTLSVVYPATAFAKHAPVPVVGIVEIGSRMMAERLKADSASRLVLFGTETTVGEDAHRALMRPMGIPMERMAAQACPDLAGEIQSDPASDVVRTMVEMYAAEGAGRLVQSPAHTIIGLCCTHYGYVAPLFVEAVRRTTGGGVEVIDPNMGMADVLFAPSCTSRFVTTEVLERVFTRASISTGEIESIARLLEPISAQTALALRQVEIDTELFTIPERP
jgi:glutamate racemase